MSYIPIMDVGMEVELVDCGNCTICTCWILRNGRDHLRDWLGCYARISVAMYNCPL